MKNLPANIRFIGVDDDNLDLFESQYPLRRGISYNSYLLDGSTAIAIIDSVDSRCVDQWLERLNAALDGRLPDFLIINHIEPDHAGGIVSAMELYPAMKVVATEKAFAMFAAFFPGIDIASRAIIAKEGMTLDVGSSTLTFIMAPMVHWPEVMMTLDETDRILFSADAFGAFALSTDDDAWPGEARRYYANIVGKYGPSVRKVMDKLKGGGFDMIASLHGPLLCGDLSDYWLDYYKWSGYEPEEEGVLVAYASIYGNTARAALTLADALNDAGAGIVVPFDLCRHDVSEAVSQAFRLSRLVLCSATMDAALFPPMDNFLHHLAAKNFRNRRVGIIENGSWAPVAGRIMAERIGKMPGMVIVEPRISIRSSLSQADMLNIRALARELCNLPQNTLSSDNDS